MTVPEGRLNFSTNLKPKTFRDNNNLAINNNDISLSHLTSSTCTVRLLQFTSTVRFSLVTQSISTNILVSQQTLNIDNVSLTTKHTVELGINQEEELPRLLYLYYIRSGLREGKRRPEIRTVRYVPCCLPRNIRNANFSPVLKYLMSGIYSVLLCFRILAPF